MVDEPVNPQSAYEESFHALQRECVDAMLGHGTVTQTATEHIGSLEATFAAYESAKTGALVEVA